MGKDGQTQRWTMLAVKLSQLKMQINCFKNFSAYICTSDNNYGMHKCDNLPHYKNSTVECKLTVEEARYKEGCVDWNQV